MQVVLSSKQMTKTSDSAQVERRYPSVLASVSPAIARHALGTIKHKDKLLARCVSAKKVGAEFIQLLASSTPATAHSTLAHSADRCESR